MGPALSRLDIFRGNATIRHIVGQGKTTVDFNEILNGEGSQRIVLLRMPVYLSQEVKAIVGTMILSQVVHAAFNRDKLPEGKRRYFAIYCDEFQEFATPDFARLFTQTGKFKVMPAVAHQTRLGQFAPGDPNQGATLTAPNKVLFSLSVHDAQELALEFAGEPPTETRLEEQYVISQYPVRDLLQGHTNPDIRRFVNQYLRYLHDRREDAREDMEGERLLRLGDLDDATLYGVDERLAGVTDPSFYDKQIESLEKRSLFLMSAKERTAKIRDLHETSKRLRLTIRALNRVLTDVMEGTCREGQEAFSDFLIGLAGSYSGVPENYTKLLELYISVKYGDRHVRRVVPFAFADKHRMFEPDLAAGYRQSE